MIYPIRYYGDPVLRKKAREITEFNDELKTVAENMVETMYDAYGIGLAAPQVGLLKRMFVAIETDPDAKEGKDDDDSEEPKSIEELRTAWNVIGEYVMVNPKIVSRSGTQHGADGCLSTPGIFHKAVKRDMDIVVEYQDVSGKEHTLETSGRFSHIIQHEYDHLDGILFMDRLPDAEKRAFMQENREEFAEIQRDSKHILKQVRQNKSLQPVI